MSIHDPALGQMAYHAGLSAEDAVAADYNRRGYQVSHRRWRGKAGEIDLVIRGADDLIFVEVKKSTSFDRAAERLSGRQMTRLCNAAEEFLGFEPLGSMTPMRFDVALLDRHGDLRIIENAFGA